MARHLRKAAQTVCAPNLALPSLLKVCLLGPVLVFAYLPPAGAQGLCSGSGWGPSQQYDNNGFNPSVALTDQVAVEVHNGTGGAGPLWYRVGQVNGTSINWSNSQKYDNNGFNPSVAVNISSDPATSYYGTVVEVHNGTSGAGPLWYRVGIIIQNNNGFDISWGDSYQYDNGFNPAVTISGQNVVEVHNGTGGAGPLWYRVGQINGMQINWSNSYQYDNGFNPSVAFNGSGIVEVHNGSYEAGPMWYRTGTFSGNGTTIQWENSVNYDTGWNPKVAYSPNSGSFLLIEVDNGGGAFGPMWFHIGGNGNPLWGPSNQFGEGFNPSLSIGSGGAAVEVHNGTGGAGPLWYQYQLTGC